MDWVIWFIAVGFVLVAFCGAGKLNATWDQASKRDLEEMRKTLNSHDEFGWHSAERRQKRND